MRSKQRASKLAATTLAVIAALITSPGAASAVVTFGLEVGGSSTITLPAPGTTITANVVVDVPAGELVGTYGISVQLDSADTFITASSMQPAPLFPAGTVVDAGGGLISQFAGIGFFSMYAHGPFDAVIGTVTFQFNGTPTLYDIGFLREGIDGIGAEFVDGVAFSPLLIVPEPSTGLLFTLGLVAMQRTRRLEDD